MSGHEDEQEDLPPEQVVEALAERYRFDRRLGSGGMATVYLARDRKYDKPVALKILRPELATAIGVEQFLREIATTAALSHPNMLELLDSGVVEGQYYFVMPFVPDGTLRQRIESEGKLSLRDAVQITCEIARALHYAHSKRVVHRDVKPANILIWDGHAMLADFGIAYTDASADRLTKSGIRVGTPEYMSPEQATGARHVDHRSDLFSLGCVLYEMLAGEPPFTGKTAQDVFYKVIVDPPPPIRTVRPDLPVPVERAMLKALAKASADRFESANEFAEALLQRDDQAEALNSIAVLPFENLTGSPDDDYFAEGMTVEIINALARVRGLHVAAITSSLAFRGRGVNLAEVGAKLHVVMVLVGNVRREGDQLRIVVQLVKVSDGYQIWSERYDRRMTDVFAIQDEIANAVVERLRITLDAEHPALVTPPTKNLDAYHLYLRGRYALEQRKLDAALASFGRALALDGEYALAQAGFADACTLTAQYGFAPARVFLEKGEAAVIRALSLAPDLAEAHCAAGTLALVFGWDWERASRELRRAVELNPNYVAARYWLALYLTLVAGNAEEGIVHARRAVELDPLAALPWAQLGMALIGAGRHEDAIAPLVRSAELGPDLLIPNLYLGVNHLHLGKASEALAALETARRVSGRHPFALSALAVYHATLGNPAVAHALHDELEARSRHEYVQAAMLSLTTAAIGRVDEAFQLLDKACDERDGVMIFAKRYPAFALLQRDPRMERIYQRIGFPA